MTQVAAATVSDRCDKCSGEIEPDGFCSWHGQLFDLWLCDDCVHEARTRGVNLGIVRPSLTLDQIESSLDTLQLAIRNMGMVNIITGQDGALANRDVAVFLDFRESKRVYALLTDILRAKIDAAKDEAAEQARAVLKRLNR